MPRTAELEAVGCGIIEKRGKWWHFRWTDEAGRRRREALKVTTKDAARTKARSLSASIEDHTWTPRGQRRRLRFIDVAEEFVAHVRATAKRTAGVEYELSTAEGYAGILRRMQNSSPFMEDHVAAVTPSCIEAWLNDRQDRDGVRLATRNRELAFVKSVYRWAAEAQGIRANPAAAVKIVGREELDPRRRATRALTVAELENLLVILEKRGGLVYGVCLCAADTGLRRGSLQALRWHHIDWEERLIRLPNSKGKKALEAVMTDRLFLHLQSMYASARTRTINGTVLLHARILDLPVFPSVRDVTQPFDNVRKGLLKASEKAGVGRVNLHMLRHTFCTQSADAGVPAFVLQEQMGHRNLATTQKYYHASRKGKRQAMSLLQRARGDDSARAERGSDPATRTA